MTNIELIEKVKRATTQEEFLIICNWEEKLNLMFCGGELDVILNKVKELFDPDGTIESSVEKLKCSIDDYK